MPGHQSPAVFSRKRLGRKCPRDVRHQDPMCRRFGHAHKRIGHDHRHDRRPRKSVGVHQREHGRERFVISAVEGLLEEKFGSLCSQVIDGAGEITNIIVGGVKSALGKSDFGFSHITVPSVIVGQNFTIAYAPGLEYLTVTFEHVDADAIRLEDRMMHVSMSLLTL